MSPVRGGQPGIPQHGRTSDTQGLVAARGLTSQGPQSCLPEGLAVSVCCTDLPHSTQGPEVLWQNLTPQTGTRNDSEDLRSHSFSVQCPAP